MIDKIRNKNQYEQVHQLIEGFIKKATKGGGFNSLNKKDTEELHQLTLLAADYEKNSLKILCLLFAAAAFAQQPKKTQKAVIKYTINCDQC